MTLEIAPRQIRVRERLRPFVEPPSGRRRAITTAQHGVDAVLAVIEQFAINL